MIWRWQRFPRPRRRPPDGSKVWSAARLRLLRARGCRYSRFLTGCGLRLSGWKPNRASRKTGPRSAPAVDRAFTGSECAARSSRTVLHRQPASAGVAEPEPRLGRSQPSDRQRAGAWIASASTLSRSGCARTVLAETRTVLGRVRPQHSDHRRHILRDGRHSKSLLISERFTVRPCRGHVPARGPSENLDRREACRARVQDC
jgi:hypothetical protein